MIAESKIHALHKHMLVFALLATLIVSLCFASVLSDISSFTSGAPNQLVVSNEAELLNAINTSIGSTSIALNKDITLSEALVIPINKSITLTSKSNVKFYKLLGANNTSTIFVDSDSVLELDGIIVTHVNGVVGCGVIVARGGTLVLFSGEISGNTGGGYGFFGFGYSNGGGVYVGDGGCFVMSGGRICDNIASRGGGVFNGVGATFTLEGGVVYGNGAINSGGGVYNEWCGDFQMLGGEISGNTATSGGGVYNCGGGIRDDSTGYTGCFSLFGGVISGNVVVNDGGGVGNYGVFVMSGGVIAGNTADRAGGGVHNGNTLTIADFQMLGGEISGNVAAKGGGVYHFFGNRFSLSDGMIVNNEAEIGGGVCIDSDFVMSGGKISGNTANSNGGGVYVGNGVFKLLGGKISKNTATYNGGGIWVDTEKLDLLFVSNAAVFSNNLASVAYERASTHNDVYRSQIGGKVTWTRPFTQGYNNYDISYTSGSQIIVTADESSDTDDELSTDNRTSGIPGYIVFAVLSLVLAMSIVGSVFLYFKKKNIKQK